MSAIRILVVDDEKDILETLADLLGIEVVLCQGLLEYKEVLEAIVSLQGGRDLGFALGTPTVTHLCQDSWIVLAGGDRPDDAQTGDACDVADSLG